MIQASLLLGGIPIGLRDPLLNEYKTLMTAFLQSNWKYSALDAARFCEVVYSILHGAVSGTFAEAPKKPPDFVSSCRALEQNPPLAVGDRSLRILLPRALPPVYEVRSNRNVGHIGGDVVSNKMDATYVVATCTFVVAELVRIFHNCSTTEAQEAVDALVDRKCPLVWEYDGGKRVMHTGMVAADKALVLLYSETEWTCVVELAKWVKYRNLTHFRDRVLVPLDRSLRLEFDRDADRCSITPLGIRRVEDDLLNC